MSGTILDWSGNNGPRATVGNTGDLSRDLQPCVLCRRPALLRHPVTNLPCHKICEEARLDKVAAEAGERS